MFRFRVRSLTITAALASCVAISIQSCKAPLKSEAQLRAKVDGLSGSQLLDVNDVSMLFPLDRTQEFPLGQFMSTSMFRDTIASGQGNGANAISEINFAQNGANIIDNWRIVSMRYDPCAPGAHAALEFSKQLEEQKKGEGPVEGTETPGKDDFCQNQVRLIAQPFNGGADQDFAIHLLYAQGKDASSIERQIRGLQKIKKIAKQNGVDTTGTALQIHPGMNAAGRAGDLVTAAVKSFLKENCKNENLVSLAVMGLASGPEPWTFYANRVSKGKPVLAPIPTIDGGTSQKSSFQSLAFIGPQRVLGLPSNKTTFPFPVFRDGSPELVELNRKPILDRSTTVILNGTRTDFENGNSGGKLMDDTTITPMTDRMLGLLHAIDNPDRNHFFTLDCVSCHTSSNLMLRRHIVASEQGNRDEVARIEGPHPSRFVVPKGITGYVAPSALQDQEFFGRPWSLRNFGYFKGEPSIAFRTATETAEVLKEINLEIIGSSQAGPNACKTKSGWREAESKLWSCVQFSEGKNSKQCIEEICGGSGSNSRASDNSNPAFKALSVINSKFGIIHGQNDEFRAVLTVQSPSNPLEPNFNLKFFVRHSPNDISNMGFEMKENGKVLEGVRYNMAFAKGQKHKVRLEWDPASKMWKGQMSFSAGRQEQISMFLRQ